MIRFICLLLIFSILFFSCSTTIHNLTAKDCDRINEKTNDEEVELTLYGSEEEIEAEKLHIETDSLSFVDNEMSALWSLPTRQVEQITYADHLDGLYWGLGIGAALLVFAALVGGKEENNEAHYGGKELFEGIGKGISVLILVSAITLPLGLFIRGTDYSFIIGDEAEWKDFKSVRNLIFFGGEEKACEVLNKIIDESSDESQITTALYLKIKFELADQQAIYDRLNKEYPGSIHTMLAKKLLIDREIIEQ
jgi:hypothetical protein